MTSKADSINNAINENDAFLMLLNQNYEPKEQDSINTLDTPKKAKDNDLNDKYNDDIKELKKTPKTSKEYKQKLAVVKEDIINKMDHSNYKFKNADTKRDNATITIKLDADIEQFLLNIQWIKFIEDRESINETEYINRLIRADLKRTLKIPQDANDPKQWINAYNEYAKSNRIPYKEPKRTNNKK